MTFIILEIIFLPLTILMAAQFGKRQRIRRAEKMEAYRRSPESHILKLHD